MAKNIVIQNGSDPVQYLNGVTRIRTELQEGGYCDWLPEDEVDITPGGSGGSGSGSSETNLIEKTVTRNGEYDAYLDDGASGYSKVNVSLPLGTKTISENGTFRAAYDAFAGYSAVTVNVGTDYLGDTTEVAAYIERNMSIVSNSYVSKVAPYAFYLNSTITSVNFPNATEIGSNTFWSCTRLLKMYAPSIKSIGSNAFDYCYRMTECNLGDDIAFVGECAFRSCQNMTYIEIPLVNSILTETFAGCISLSNINADIVERVESYAFTSCISLMSLSLPLASTIGSYAFSGCTSLSFISLPIVRIIGSYAFNSCTSLTSISLPFASSIGFYAFSGCTSLMSLYLLGSNIINIFSKNVFSNTPISNSSILGTYGSIYVLEGMISAYKTASYWSAYSDRITAYVE